MPRDGRIAREAILDAADALFGEQGFDATTTRQTAERSGVNKALIHYHFESKEALFHAVLARYYVRLAESLGPALAQGGGSVRQRYGALLDAYVDFLWANRNFSRMLQREIAGGRHVEHIAALMLPIFETGVAGIEEAFPRAAAHDLAPIDLLVSFFGMVATWFAYAPVVENLLGDDPLSDAHLTRRKRHLHRMLDLVVGSLQRSHGD